MTPSQNTSIFYQLSLIYASII